MNALSPFQWRRRVGMRDVDAWGIVWYGNYLGFCDEARAELLRSFGIHPGDFATLGFTAPIVELQSRYHASAHYDEEIDVHIHVHPPRGSKIIFDFRIERPADRRHLSQIRTTQVLVRSGGAMMYVLPEMLKPAFANIMAAQEALAAEVAAP